MSGFVSLQYYKYYLLKLNSAATLSDSRLKLPMFPPALNKPNDKAVYEAEREESNLAQKTSILRPPLR